MKKKVFWVVAMVCCIGFSSMNVVKSGIKNLQFLMTVSSETLANAEAIEDGEGGEAVEKKCWNRYWDYCSYKASTDLTVQFYPAPGLSYKSGAKVMGLEGKVEHLEDGGGMYQHEPNHIQCGDNKKPENEPMIS